MGDRILTAIGRTSWVFLGDEGDPKETGPNKFKLTHMLPKNVEAVKSLGLNSAQQKSIVADAKKCKESIEAQCMAMAKAKFKDSWESSRWNPIIDGDTKAAKQPINKNFWLIRAKTQYQPKIRNADDTEFVDPNDSDVQSGFYTGCWARCFIEPYAYSVSGNEGVAVGLGGVQKAYNDEKFQMVEEESFGGIVDKQPEAVDFGDVE